MLATSRSRYRLLSMRRRRHYERRDLERKREPHGPRLGHERPGAAQARRWPREPVAVG